MRRRRCGSRFASSRYRTPHACIAYHCMHTAWARFDTGITPWFQAIMRPRTSEPYGTVRGVRRVARQSKISCTWRSDVQALRDDLLQALTNETKRQLPSTRFTTSQLLLADATDLVEFNHCIYEPILVVVTYVVIHHIVWQEDKADAAESRHEGNPLRIRADSRA